MTTQRLQLAPGDPVRLRTPGNVRLDGAPGEVEAVFRWGVLVKTLAAGSGQYRAGWDEVTPLTDPSGQVTEPAPTPVGINGQAKATAQATARSAARVAREQGYVGDPCSICQGMAVRRNGSCTVCETCGATSGCG